MEKETPELTGVSILCGEQFTAHLVNSIAAVTNPSTGLWPPGPIVTTFLHQLFDFTQFRFSRINNCDLIVAAQTPDSLNA